MDSIMGWTVDRTINWRIMDLIMDLIMDWTLERIIYWTMDSIMDWINNDYFCESLGCLSMYPRILPLTCKTLQWKFRKIPCNHDHDYQ